MKKIVMLASGIVGCTVLAGSAVFADSLSSTGGISHTFKTMM